MSLEEQDREIGRLVREYHERRREFAALTAKVKKIGEALGRLSSLLRQADADRGMGDVRYTLEEIAKDVDLTALRQLLGEYAVMDQRLRDDRQALQRLGIDRP